MELSFVGLLKVFLIGFGLNLTPCIYPMLTVTVALFSGRREANPLSAFGRALLYVLGICLVYSFLGTFAAFAGSFFGAAAQSPLTFLAFSILMFILALSMFGLFEMRAPSAFLTWAGGKSHFGLVGIFVSGLLVGLFAAPCIGPPILALLLLVGQEASPLSGFLIFLVLSLGLGFPYLILGTFSGLIKKLPKSGDWLIWVKRAFGILLLSFSFHYLTLAFFPALTAKVFPTFFLCGGVWIGFVDPSGNKNPGFRSFKRIIGGIFAVGALFVLFWNAGNRVQWEPYAPAKLEAAKQEGRPVIMDFYADWCVTCHELDRFTYSDSKVIAALDPFVRLKVDLTDPNSEESQKLIERFNVIGVPTIVFLDRNGKEIENARIPGFVSAKEFLEVLDLIKNKS